MKYGQTDIGSRNSSTEDMNAGRRNGSAEDRKSARSKDTDHADATGYKDKDPVKDKVRGAIATLATTDGSARRSKSSRMPTRAKGTKDVDGIGQGRKDSLEKRTLAASQTAKAPESLRYPESRKLTSEDSVTQGRMESSEKRTEPVTNDITKQSMAKIYIETIAVDNDEERTLDLGMRFGYFGLGLYDKMKIPEADKLLEVVDQIEG